MVRKGSGSHRVVSRPFFSFSGFPHSGLKDERNDREHLWAECFPAETGVCQSSQMAQCLGINRKLDSRRRLQSNNFTQGKKGRQADAGQILGGF